MRSLRSVARPVSIVAISLVLRCGLAAVAESSPTLSKKDLKTLLATAKTPSDHQKIAAYYHDQAKRLNAKAQEFSVQAERPCHAAGDCGIEAGDFVLEHQPLPSLGKDV